MAVAYLHDEVVVKEAQRRLQDDLPIRWEGNCYHAMDAWMALIGAAGMGASLAAVCREGQEAPSDNTLRDKLGEQGGPVVTQLLQQDLPRILKRSGRFVAERRHA